MRTGAPDELVVAGFGKRRELIRKKGDLDAIGAPHSSFWHLNERDRGHYDVARSLASRFDKARFANRDRMIYPRRNSTSVIPSDYYFNGDNKDSATHPAFWAGTLGEAVFVALRPRATQA